MKLSFRQLWKLTLVLPVILVTVMSTFSYPAYAAQDTPTASDIPEVVSRSLKWGGAAIEFALREDEVIRDTTELSSPYPMAFLHLKSDGKDGFLTSDDYTIFNYFVVAFNNGVPERVITSDLDGNAGGSFFLSGIEFYAKLQPNEIVLLGGPLDDRYILSASSSIVRPLNDEGQEVFAWGGAHGEMKVQEFRRVKPAYDAEVQANYDKVIQELYGDDIPKEGVVGGLATLPLQDELPRPAISPITKIALGLVLTVGSIFSLTFLHRQTRKTAILH